MTVRYRFELSQAEREEQTAMPGGGKHAARKLKPAQIFTGGTAAAATRRLPRPSE